MNSVQTQLSIKTNKGDLTDMPCSLLASLLTLFSGCPSQTSVLMNYQLSSSTYWHVLSLLQFESQVSYVIVVAVFVVVVVVEPLPKAPTRSKPTGFLMPAHLSKLK
jgi:hypothetical protein